MNWNCSGTSHGCSIGSGSGEFGDQVSAFNSLSCSLGHFLCSLCGVAWRRGVAIGKCHCHEKVFARTQSFPTGKLVVVLIERTCMSAPGVVAFR